MSTVKLNHFQVGQNATATQNFTITQGADGSGKIARGNQGATTQDIITWDGAGKVTLPQGETPVVSKLVSGTPIATTSGTSHDFTGIPSWVKRITVSFVGVSTNGTSTMTVRLGTAGGIEATGYLHSASQLGVGTNNSTTGFDCYSTASATLNHGQYSFILVGSNMWTMVGNLAFSNAASQQIIAGSKTLSGTLDRVRLTTVNGTDTFDAGSVNIMYE